MTRCRISGEQLRSAVQSLAVLSLAIGLHALLGITSTALSARLATALTAPPDITSSSSSSKGDLPDIRASVLIGGGGSRAGIA